MTTLHSVEPLAEDQDRPLTLDERAELDAHRALSARLLDACRAAGAGDLEARVHQVSEAEDLPELVELRHAFNRVLDLSDAFIREAGAALTAAGEGRYHRRVLERGLPGQFRVGVAAINAGQAQMRVGAERVVQATDERRELSAEFEQVVVGLTEHLVDASRQLSASSADLSRSSNLAGQEMEQARATVDSLSESSRQIQDVVKVIDTIAAQTRLLALNATIEAARVGELGKGFAVVASEVKELANQTQRATQQVGEQVEMIQAATRDAVQVMTNAGTTVQEMNGKVAEMAAAVEGDGGSHEGLTRATLNLRGEATRFLGVMRG